MKNSLKYASLPLFVFCLLAGAAGCGSKKKEETTIGDLCRARCESDAAACPEGSIFQEFCSFSCLLYEDNADCREKFEAQSDCLAMYPLDCDTGSPVDTNVCAEEGEPFLVDGTGADSHGECINASVTVE